MATKVENLILAAHETTNEVDWEEIRNQLDPRERRQMHDVLRDMKRRGMAWRKAWVDSEGKSHVTIVKGAHPNAVSGGD